MSNRIIRNVIDVDSNMINEIIQDSNIKSLSIYHTYEDSYLQMPIFIKIACNIIIKSRKDICIWYHGFHVDTIFCESDYDCIFTTFYSYYKNLEEYFYKHLPIPDYVENWLYDGKKRSGNFYLDLSDHIIQKITKWAEYIDIQYDNQLFIRMLHSFKNRFDGIRVRAEFLKNKEILNLLTIQLNRSLYANVENTSKKWKNDFINMINFDNEHKIYVHAMNKQEYYKLDKYDLIFKKLCAKTGCNLKIYYTTDNGLNFYYSELFRDYKVYQGSHYAVHCVA